MQSQRQPARIAIVRERLEDREISNYVELAGRFAPFIVTSGEKGPYAATGLGLQVRRTSSLRQRVGRRTARVIERLTTDRWDWDAMPGLVDSIGGCDVVVANETHMASSAALSEYRARGGPPIVTVCYENIPFRYEEIATLRRRKDMVRRWTDRFVALTPEAAAALETEGVSRERIDRVTYGVDPARFVQNAHEEIRRGWGAQPGDLLLLYTGRLLQEKGLVPLLSAVALLKRRDVRLVLVGGGPELPRIRAAARAMEIDDRLHQVSWVDHSRIPEVLASADAFVMPSLPTPYWEEQLGFSMIEAMAAGLPVVAVGSGSIPYILGDGGLITPPYDVPALSRALARIVDDNELRGRLGSAGRRRVNETLNTKRAAQEIGSVIERVLRETTTP